MEQPNTNTPPADAGTPPADAGTPPSGLPSDIQNQTTVRDTFTTIGDEAFSGDKGLFKGRWNSPDEMADYIQNLETKHTNLGREVTDNAKKETADVTKAAETARLEVAKSDTIRELAPAFMANNMELNDDMLAKLKEVGLDERDVKLGAYEIRERVDGYAKVVGGKENYDAMMAWAVDGLDDNGKRDFNNGLNSTNSELVIEGLNARYHQALNNPDASKRPDRIRGNPAPHTSVKPYATRAELFADKKFADSNRSSTNDKKRYHERLAVTPDSVWQ